jgi:hypothetical protein
MAKNNTEAPEKDIVSFAQALELCSIGFDEPTFCMYEIENKQLCLCYLDEDGLYMPDKDFHAPTKGQVFRWFREKYEWYANLSSWLHEEDIGTYHEFEIYGANQYAHGSVPFKTYEEAENACIDKLISICKQQDK